MDENKLKAIWEGLIQEAETFFLTNGGEKSQLPDHHSLHAIQGGART